MPSTKLTEPTESGASSLSETPHIFQGEDHCSGCAESSRLRVVAAELVRDREGGRPVPLGEAPLYEAAKKAHDERQAAFQAVVDRASEDAPSYDQTKEELGGLLDARDASYEDPPLTPEEEEGSPEDRAICACGFDPYLDTLGHRAGCPTFDPIQPVRRPPYAVAYSVDGHLYEVACPGDATVTAVDGALIIKHGAGQVAGIVGIQPILATEAS